MKGTENTRRQAILVAEDDRGMRELLTEILESGGFAVVPAADGTEAVLRLKTEAVDAVLTDLKMPGADGMAVLQYVVENHPGLPVVVLTAHGTIPGAVTAMKRGAFDFITKPLASPEQLRQVMARALSASAAGNADDDPEPLAEDPAFARVLELARTVAGRDTTVLLLGESGSGKEVVARYLHRQSPRRDGPFVAVNCAAIPETLLESQLFGHEKGAFTGADRARAGTFEHAHGGTLLLDEVGEMGQGVQVKFLRVLEERSVIRLGSDRPVNVDVRIVSATNRDLEEAVRNGRFREDLYFRLNVFPIRIPPLRERPADILPLMRRFLTTISGRTGRTPPGLSDEAMEALTACKWPGNVRQLQNTAERASILAGDGPIRPEHLGLEPVDASRFGEAGTESPHRSAATTLKAMEKQAILDALQATGGNRKKAARRLGIALRTLQYKIKEYKIT